MNEVIQGLIRESDEDIFEDFKLLEKLIAKRMDLEHSFNTIDIDSFENDVPFYPKQIFVDTSTVVILNHEEESNNETKTFLKIIQDSGHTTGNASTACWNCCLVERNTNITRLDFNSEIDYLAFLVQIRLWTSCRSQSVRSHVGKGLCRVHSKHSPTEGTSQNGVINRNNALTSIFHLPKFHGVIEQKWNTYLMKEDVFTVMEESTSCNLFRASVQDIIALILCKDYLLPNEYLLNVQVTFPPCQLLIRLKTSFTVGDKIIEDLGQYDQKLLENSCNVFFPVMKTTLLNNIDVGKLKVEVLNPETNGSLLTSEVDCAIFNQTKPHGRNIDQVIATEEGNPSMFVRTPIPQNHINTKLHVTVSVPLSNELAESVLRLFVSGANGINSANGNIPSTYCTIYLLDKNGNRLSTNNAEMRTLPCKSKDPVWEKEFFLNVSHIHTAQVEYVMLLLRDANSGLLKHRHIGQVLIPLVCFLEDIDANMCLPIEPSHRMNAEVAEKSYLGEVHVRTRLLTRSAASSSPANNKEILHDSNGTIASVKLRVFRSIASVTWWPCSMLSLEEYCGNLVCANRASSSDTNRRTEGFILLGIESVKLRLGASGVCESIAYNEDISLLPLTDSVAIFALKGNGALWDKVILVGPCPSACLIRSFVWRKRNVTTLLSGLITLKKTSKELEIFKKSDNAAGSMKSSPPKLPKLMSLRNLMQYNHSSPSADTLFYDILRCSRNLSSILELNFRPHIQGGGNHADFSYSVAYCNALLQFVKALCVEAGSFSSQEAEKKVLCFQSKWIHDKILEDFKKVGLDEKEFCSHLGSEIRGVDDDTLVKLRCFLEDGIMHLRDCLLLDQCWNTKSNMSSQDSMKLIIEQVSRYLRCTIDPFIETKSTFLRVKGMEMKLNLIVFVLWTNFTWNANISAFKYLADEVDTFDKDTFIFRHHYELLQWFVSAIRQDIHLWITKTMEHFNCKRENRYSLPWDVQLLGGQWCSSIPETVATQLSVYSQFDFAGLEKDLPSCATELRRFRIDLTDSISKTWYFILSEFCQSLLCRHWDSAEDSATVEAFSSFLMALGNDFLRIVSRFLPHIQDDNKVSLEMIRSMISLLVTQITKLIFSTTQSTILNFESIWVHEMGCSVLINNLTQHFKRIKSSLNPSIFQEVVASCKKVIVLRYLLMVKNRLLSKVKCVLEGEEVDRLIGDIERLTIFFREWPDSSSTDTLQYLYHLAVILKQEHNKSSFTDSLLWMIRLFDTSDAKQLGFVEFLLLTCFLPLRMDASTEIYVHVATEIRNSAENHRYQARISIEQIREADSYWRLFADIRLGWDEDAFGSSYSIQPAIGQDLGGSANSKAFPLILASLSSNFHALKSSQVTQALKSIREKIADVRIPIILSTEGSTAVDKELDELALYIMRSINLDQKDSTSLQELWRTFQEMYFAGEDILVVGHSIQDSNRLSPVISVFPNNDTNPTKKIESMVNLIWDRIELKNVASHSIIGNANPYVVFTIGEIRFKTTVKWDTKGSCIWNEMIEQRIPLSLLMKESLSINVYDKERIRRKRLIGGIVLQLNPFVNRAHASWYALESSEVIASEIFLSFRIETM